MSSPKPTPRRITTAAQKKAQRSSSILMANSHLDVVKQPNTDTPRLAFYGRRSMLKDASNSVARQNDEAHDLITFKSARGATHNCKTDDFYDDDISASGKHYRPAMEQLIRLCQEGHYDGIVVYEFERYARNGREHRIMLDILRASGVEFYAIRQPHLTLFGPYGNVMMEFAIMQAEAELNTIVERTTSAHQVRAAHGAWRQNRVPFGMRRTTVPSTIAGRSKDLPWLTPDRISRPEPGTDHSPYDLVNEAAKRISRGISVGTIAKDWNSRGIPSPTGALWHRDVIKNIVSSITMLGYATYKAEPVLGDDGQPRAFYEPVLTKEVYDAAQAALAERSFTPSRGECTSLLRSIIRCGDCGGGLNLTGNNSARAASYSCPARYTKGPEACGGVSFTARYADEYVTEWFMGLLENQDLLAEALRRLTPGSPSAPTVADNTAALVELEEERKRVVRMYRLGMMDDAEFTASAADLKSRTEALTPRTVKPFAPRLAELAGPDARAKWSALTQEERNLALLDIVYEVRIAPAPEGLQRGGYRPKGSGHTPDMDRLTLVMKSADN